MKIPKLSELMGGAADALFQKAMARAIDNILDDDTDAEQKRVITIKVVLAPNDARNGAALNVAVDSKLAAVHGEGTVVGLGRERGKPKLVELQAEMFPGGTVEPLGGEPS